MRKILLVLLVCLSMISMTLAADFTPQGNINLQTYYNITNGFNASFSGNVSGTFQGDGSGITGVSASDTDWLANWTAYNDTWSSTTNSSYFLVTDWNATNTSYFLVTDWNSTNTTYAENNDSMNNYILENNQSVNSYILFSNSTLATWVDQLFVRFSEIVAQVGNWSADKGDYSTTTEITAQNTSQTNYINDNNDSVENTFGSYLLTTGVTAQNTSQTNYINFANTSVTNTFGSYYTKTEADALNTSQTNYIEYYSDWNNDSVTNYAASLVVGGYDDAWINETIYSKTEVVAINTSMKNYVDSVGSGDANWDATFNATLLVVDTALNDSINNYVDDTFTTETYVDTQNNSVVNWVTATYATIASLGSYVTWTAIWGQVYNETEVDAINTSMKNYVDTQDSAQDACSEITGCVENAITSLAGDSSPQLAGYLDTAGQNIGSTADEIENVYVADNSRIYFGNGQDASIYYNGTALIIG